MFIVLLQSIKWNNSETQSVRRGEFLELMLVTLFGMYLMVSARHFLIFVIGLETASLPLAALAAFDKKQYESHEAAVKYLFTAVFSSAIYMLGLSFVYAFTGSLYFSDIAASVMLVDGQFLLYVAMAFVIAGIGFKISLVPFHLWTADVYQGAPTSVTSYLSVVSKGAAAFAAFVVLTQAFGAVYSQVWEWMLYALIILTITLGNLFAIRQTNMKRFPCVLLDFASRLHHARCDSVQRHRCCVVELLCACLCSFKPCSLLALSRQLRTPQARLT